MVGAMEPLVLPEPAVRSALTSLPWWTLDALVVEAESVAGALAHGVAAVVEPVAAAWADAGPGAAVQAGLVAVPDPVACWAACTLVALRAGMLVAGEEAMWSLLPRTSTSTNLSLISTAISGFLIVDRPIPRDWRRRR